MLDDFADLPLVRYPMQPFQRRVLTLRNNVNAYDGFYIALAESLHMPLLTDDHTFAGAIGHQAVVEIWRPHDGG